jgi:hypothetical protein
MRLSSVEADARIRIAAAAASVYFAGVVIVVCGGQLIVIRAG